MSEIGDCFSGIDAEFVQGYADGRDPDSPTPSANRSEAYRHSWNVGRAELANRPIPYAQSKAAADAIEAQYNQDHRA